MDIPPLPVVPPKYRIWLPYWAVFQTDLRQIVSNWIYRSWVVAMTLAAFGYLSYKLGIHEEARIIQNAAEVMNDLLRWVVLGSVALVAALTVGAISSERGTLADSILSRGINRYQYFLAKWHARVASVVGTVAVLGLLMLIVSYFKLSDSLSLGGSLTALSVVAALLAVVVSFGVALSAICNTTLLGMSLLWLFLYGGGFLLDLLPTRYPTPHRVMQQLPLILTGDYDPTSIWHFIGVAALVSCLAAIVGLAVFNRKDV
jgi:ABC-2 type transport system permease protein